MDVYQHHPVKTTITTRYRVIHHRIWIQQQLLLVAVERSFLLFVVVIIIMINITYYL